MDEPSCHTSPFGCLCDRKSKAGRDYALFRQPMAMKRLSIYSRLEICRRDNATAGDHSHLVADGTGCTHGDCPRDEGDPIPHCVGSTLGTKWTSLAHH